MKCPSCGSQMGLEDRFCPYCGAPNTQAIKHQKNMDRFEADYKDTKEKVFKRTEILRRHGSLLIILVVVLIALIGAVLLNAYAWDIGYSLRERTSSRYIEEDREVLEGYLEAGDYGKFVGYYSANDVSYDLDDDYAAVKSAARAYARLFEYISAIDNPSEYIFREERLSEGCAYIADDLLRIYNVEKEYEYFSEKYLTEEKLAYIHDMQERATLIAKTYFGLTDEEISEIPNMSKSKLAEVIEEGLSR